MNKEFKYIHYSQKFYDKLNALCAPLFTALGVTDFFYQSVDSNDNLSGIGTHIELLDQYFESELYKDNPLFNQYPNLKSGGFFPITFKHKTFQNTLNFFETKFQISLAIAVLKKEGNRIHQYHFYCPIKKSSEFINLIINEYSTIQKFIHYFDDSTLKLREELYKNPDDVKSFGLKPSSFTLPLADFGVEQKIEFLKKIQFILSEDRIPKFSKREQDCIKLTLQGQTMLEMAKTLGLSPRTIESYLNNLKMKLNCYTKSELILKLQKIKEIGIYPLF
jgi:DNA-binding CsgD family transcriptional regulator